MNRARAATNGEVRAWGADDAVCWYGSVLRRCMCINSSGGGSDDDSGSAEDVLLVSWV